MKAVLNVDGKKLEVTSINYVNGKVRSVQVHLGENVYRSYEHHESFVFNDTQLLIDFSKSLEFPEIKEAIVESNNKLIEHLEKNIESENEELVNVAIEAMENTDSQPFNTHLTDMQKEYKLAQERLFGFIDAVEEIKAYTEGYYDKNYPKSVEAEKHHQSIE